MWNSSESTDQWSFNHQPIHTALGKQGSDYASYLIKCSSPQTPENLQFVSSYSQCQKRGQLTHYFSFSSTLFFSLFDVINDVVSLSVTVNSRSPPAPLVLHEFGPNNKIANTVWCLSHPGARLHVCGFNSVRQELDHWHNTNHFNLSNAAVTFEVQWKFSTLKSEAQLLPPHQVNKVSVNIFKKELMYLLNT